MLLHFLNEAQWKQCQFPFDELIHNTLSNEKLKMCKMTRRMCYSYVIPLRSRCTSLEGAGLKARDRVTSVERAWKKVQHVYPSMTSPVQ